MISADIDEMACERKSAFGQAEAVLGLAQCRINLSSRLPLWLICNYNFVMRFEWDEQKSKKNRAKHGLSFQTACLVFDDPRAISIQDRHEDGEERWQTIGRAGQAVILLVAHTFSNSEDDEEIVRIISARKATPKERKIYEQDDR